jgi:hypothetical protein
VTDPFSSYRPRKLRGKTELLSLEYCRKRSEAKRKGLEFTLTKEEFIALILSPCTYCGSPPGKQRWFKSKCYHPPVIAPPIGFPDFQSYVFVHGIDRVKSSRGYTKKNSLPCCWMCNRAKGDMLLAKFHEWISQLYENRRSWAHLIDLHKPSLVDMVPREQRRQRREVLGRERGKRRSSEGDLPLSNHDAIKLA